MRRAVVGLLTVLTLVASACSGEDDGPRDLRTLPQVERDVPTAPDRDSTVVREKLAMIDPCALFSEEAVAQLGDDIGELAATSPHACRLSGANGSVTIELGVGLSPSSRFWRSRIDAGGTVAYRQRGSGPDCTVSLPASQTLAIEVRGTRRPCPQIVTYAEAAANLLRQKPAAVTHPRDARRFTACDLLAPALPKALAPVPGNAGGALLDACAGVGVDSNALEPDVQLFLESSSPTAADEDAREFAGVAAVVNRIDGSCWVTWDLAGVPGDPHSEDVTTAMLVTDTCAEARRLIPAVETAARRTPAKGAPRDVLLPWSEVIDDVPGTGTCVDIRPDVALQCAPARPADVPDDPRDLLEQAEADPDVLCAALAPIVTEHHPTLRAATTAVHEGEESPTQCAFGEPTHALHVEVQAVTGDVLIGSADEEIAGHPVRSEVEADGPSMPRALHRVGLDPNGPGGLVITVTATPTREQGLGTGADVDPTPVEESELLVTDIVETLLR